MTRKVVLRVALVPCWLLLGGATRNQTWYGTKDCNERCRDIPRYGCSQDGDCQISASGQYFDDNCLGMCNPEGHRWACSMEGRCVRSDENGNYSERTCAGTCVAPGPAPAPHRYSCSKNGNGTCQRDESGITPYYLDPNCGGECQPPPAPPKPPKAVQTGSSAAHVVLVVVLVLVVVAAIAGGGFLALYYKRESDQRKSYSELGPKIGDPLLQ